MRRGYADAFGYEWKRHARTQVDDRDLSWKTLTAKTGLVPADFRGKRVLDVGAGAGRFAILAADAGADIVAVDITEAIEVAAENLGGRGMAIRADLFDMPFEPGTFDVVYSVGVLHHTPSTKAATEAIARMVKPGGILAVWVYHPFRSYWFSDLYRRITTRMRPATLYRVTRAMSRLYALHRIPVIGRVVRFVVPISEEPDPEWRSLDTFDWYHPTYQWKHRPAEVIGWFRALGFEEIEVLPFLTGVRGRLPAAGQLDVGHGPSTLAQ